MRNSSRNNQPHHPKMISSYGWEKSKHKSKSFPPWQLFQRKGSSFPFARVTKIRCLNRKDFLLSLRIYKLLLLFVLLSASHSLNFNITNKPRFEGKGWDKFSGDDKLFYHFPSDTTICSKHWQCYFLTKVMSVFNSFRSDHRNALRCEN